MDEELDQRLRESQAEYLNFLDDEVCEFGLGWREEILKSIFK